MCVCRLQLCFQAHLDDDNMLHHHNDSDNDSDSVIDIDAELDAEQQHQQHDMHDDVHDHDKESVHEHEPVTHTHRVLEGW